MRNWRMKVMLVREMIEMVIRMIYMVASKGMVAEEMAKWGMR